VLLACGGFDAPPRAKKVDEVALTRETFTGSLRWSLLAVSTPSLPDAVKDLSPEIP
jgi:hypothetical protein